MSALAQARRRPWSALFAIALGLPALGAVDASPVPWPGGRPPSATELQHLADEAIRTRDADRLREVATSLEDQQENEIVGILQQNADTGVFTKEVLQSYGHRVFNLELSPRLGFGGVVPGPRLARVHDGARGGLDTHACAGCHSVGGRDGAGAATENALVDGDGEHASSANARNPPALQGSGLLQALAVEMTHALQAEQGAARAEAAKSGASVQAPLMAKGVSFGFVKASPDGAVDTSGVEGVSADLVVRPFGWKGTEARLRRMVEEASRIHFGVQTDMLAKAHRGAPDPAHLGRGEHWYDPDGDGVERELSEGIVTAAAVYLAMLEAPVLLPPKSPRLLERWAEGDALFDKAGCSSCHTRALHLDDRMWREAPDTTAGPPVVLNLLADGDEPRGNDEVRLFSDLKRHDMGEALADRRDSLSGVPRRVFLTRPLWGLAETAPYLHDGRAPAIPDAILAHGGEAQASRDAYAALPPEQQASLHVFLLSLTRTPKVRAPL